MYPQTDDTVWRRGRKGGQRHRPMREHGWTCIKSLRLCLNMTYPQTGDTGVWRRWCRGRKGGERHRPMLESRRSPLSESGHSLVRTPRCLGTQSRVG